MQSQELNVSAVLVGERYRRTLGDLTPLMRSMARDGQRQPIVVLDNHELLAGERRLEAARRLGWDTIRAYTVYTLADALKALKADWESATGEYCLDMTTSERVAQVEPLRDLHARDREMPPKNTPRAKRWVYQVEPHLTDLLGIGLTVYRHVRLAVLTASGRRPTPGRPVTDLDRKLAQQALEDMDSGHGVDSVGTRLRAQLGYANNARSPRLPTDPDRIPPTRFARIAPGRRPPLLDQFNGAVSQLLLAARKLDKLAADDRWRTQHRQVPPAVRVSMKEIVERLVAVQRQIPPPTPKDDNR